jgi:hypothetical protein
VVVMQVISRARVSGLFEWNSGLSRTIDFFIGIPSALTLAVLSGDGFFLSVGLSVWTMVIACVLGFAACLVLLYVTIARAHTKNRKFISMVLALGVLMSVPVTALLLSLPGYSRFVLATLGACLIAIKHIVTLSRAASRAAMEVHP